MTFALEEIVANAVVKAAPTVAWLAYRVRVEGWKQVDKGRAAIFVVKHQSMVDFVASTYAFGKVLKKQSIIAAKAELFKNKFLALVLEGLGGEPMTRPNDKGYNPINAERLNSNRRMIRHLHNNGWYTYCPEGTRVKGAVGMIEPEFIHPLMIAERLGVNVYVVGLEYKTAKWLQRLPLWTPLLTRVVARCEPYSPAGKSIELVTYEIRKAMARLSGIEGKLVPGYAERTSGASAAVSRRK